MQVRRRERERERTSREHRGGVREGGAGRERWTLKEQEIREEREGGEGEVRGKEENEKGGKVIGEGI